MEHKLALLKFQIDNLDYRFQNYGLLTKALTHSINNAEIDPNFPLNNRDNRRLGVVGEAVLKLATSEYVIRSSESVQDDQGDWTIRRSDLLKVEKQEEVGKRFFHPSKECSLISEYERLVRINSGNWSNPSFKVPYANFVKAIFGAVFIDSGGSRAGTETCFKLFLKLWEPHLPKNQKLKKLQDLFPPPEPEVISYWKEIYSADFIGKLFSRLKLKTKKLQFKSKYLFLEAIIQKSFYQLHKLSSSDSFKLLGKRLPHYERLELLGDAVLDVIIAEYLWTEYPNYDYTSLSNQKTKLTVGERQSKISKNIWLKSFVQVDPDERWNGFDDIIESLIAAVYLTFNSERTREFVFQHWKLSSTAIAADLTDLQYKIGYKFCNEETLSKSLTHISVIKEPLSMEALQKHSKDFSGLGAVMIQLIATEYAFRASKIGARAGAVDALCNYLCGKSVMTQICEYLRLKDLVKVNENLKNGNTPFQRYEHFVFSVMGAILKEMDPNKGLDKLKEIFYRVWNPYLKQAPKRTFLDCFVPNDSSVYSKLEERMDPENYQLFQTLKLKSTQSHRGHKFQNDTLPLQALIPRKFKMFTSNPSVGDSDRFFSIGVLAALCHVVFHFETKKEARTGEPIERDDDSKDLSGIEDLIAILGAIFVDIMTTPACGITDWFSFFSKLANKNSNLDKGKSSVKETTLESVLPTTASGVTKQNSRQNITKTGGNQPKADHPNIKSGSLKSVSQSPTNNLKYYSESSSFNDNQGIRLQERPPEQPIERVRKVGEGLIPNSRENTSTLSPSDQIADFVLKEIQVHVGLLKSYPSLKESFDLPPTHMHTYESLQNCSLKTLQVRFDCSKNSLDRLKTLNSRFRHHIELEESLNAFRLAHTSELVLKEIKICIELFKSHPELQKTFQCPSYYEFLSNCSLKTLQNRFDCSSESLHRLKLANAKLRSQIELEKSLNAISQQNKSRNIETAPNELLSRSSYYSSNISPSKESTSSDSGNANAPIRFKSNSNIARERSLNIQSEKCGQPISNNLSNSNAQSGRNENLPTTQNIARPSVNPLDSNETSGVKWFFENCVLILILYLAYKYIKYGDVFA